MSDLNIFGLGCVAGILLLFFMIWVTGTPKDAYNNRAKDALAGKLHPIIRIENGDTTITYKLQWP